MRIKVFSSIDEFEGKPPAFEINDETCRLRVRVRHDGNWYEIVPDNQNKLTLRAPGGGQLIIKPRASNVVRVGVV